MKIADAKDAHKNKNDRLAEALRANLRRRKSIKTGSQSDKPDIPPPAFDGA